MYIQYSREQGDGHKLSVSVGDCTSADERGEWGDVEVGVQLCMHQHKRENMLVQK
jgi:hypothetical protein